MSNIKEKEAKEFVNYLNDLLKTDRKTISKLFQNRFPANKELINHPKAIVHPSAVPSFGFLGLLNGFFGSYEEGPKAGWGCIAAEYDWSDDNFENILRFVFVDEKYNKSTSC